MANLFSDLLARLRRGVKDPERDRLIAILGLNRELARAGDRRSVLTALVDHAVGLFAAERGFLVVPADDGAFRVEVARNLDRESIQNPERKLSTTIVRSALDGTPVYSEDAQDGSLGASASIADLQLRSVLCMPLRVGDRVLGCLYLDHRFHTGAFRDGDLAWLQTFADQGAIVLHLHGLLAQNRAQQEQLAEHNQRLAATVAAQAEELGQLKSEYRRDALRFAYPELVGESPVLMRALHLLDRVADTDLPVLITGESGTGKELAARALHQHSRRQRGPFVAVNVASIAPQLLESELFGHERGAFTGADRTRDGLLRAADGGTLFLDEVTEMPLEMQAKLLRCLEERRVRPVGAAQALAVDLRIVAASNRDPRQAVAEGVLREDLYFRLAVVVVHMPPLRDRLTDIPALAAHILAQHPHPERPPRVLGADVLAALQRRAWPGNVRELRNEVLRLDAVAGDGPARADLLTPQTAQQALHDLDLQRLEGAAIARALAQANGNKSLAARLLGISRRTLYSRMAAHGLDPAGS